MTYAHATTVCKQYGALLLMSNSLVLEYITDVTRYRNVDGQLKHSAVWIDNSAEGSSPAFAPECHIFHYNSLGFANIENVACNTLNPFVCQKLTVVPCKNGCFQRGICVGKTCLCDKGWDEEDCSVFHCRDVNNCSGNGICAGPNYCKCDPGWMGRACTVNYCTRFDKCRMCTKKTGCGWCDALSQCIPGNGTEPKVGSCSSWFYYECTTVEQSVGCSWHVNQLQCDTRYCNLNSSLTDRGLCQRCLDVQECFSNHGNNDGCYTWNEDKCSNGVPTRNYRNENRIYNTVFKKNVKRVSKNTLIYFCPYKLSDMPKDERQLFITMTKQKLSFKTGDIITSAQSDGIMHKVDHIITVGNLNYLLGTPVGLKDMLQYADFSQTVNAAEIMNPLTQEQDIDPEFMFMIVNGNFLEIDQTRVHIVDGHMPIYKCIGDYSLVSDGKRHLYYLVMPDNELSRNLVEGNVVVVTKTDGFLESVVNIIDSESSGIYLQTNLTQCSKNSIKNIHIESKIGKPNMSCYGGDGFPGLVHVDSLFNTGSDLIGKTIIGRRSKPSVAMVTGAAEHFNGYRFVEVFDVEYDDEGKLVANGDRVMPTKDGNRRRKRSATSFERRMAQTATYTVGCLYLHRNVN